MRRLAAPLTELSVATLFALAVAGLVFPASLFAQPRLSLDDVTAAGRIQIDILELDGRGFPAVVTAESGGRKLRFELTDESFSWTDVHNPKNVGRGSLPGLDEVASWEIELLPEGGFRAAIPSRHFERFSPEVGLPELRPDKLGEPQPKVETAGFFDPIARSFLLSAALPGGDLVDFSVSLAALPPGSDLGAATVAELSQKAWVFIALRIVLRILGLIFLTCAGLIATCGFVCSISCIHGVLDWNAQCSGNEGCNCNCAPPDPPGCQELVAQGDTLKIGGRGGLPLAASPFTLKRLEASDLLHHGQPVSFLMAEWAVAAFSVGPKAGPPELEILRTSSEDYARSQRPALEAAVASHAKSLTPGRHAALLVARPDHDTNSREIPLPRVRLEQNGFAAALDDGAILVRADFSEDRRLRDFEVLHQTVGELSPEVERALKQAIGLDYASEKPHRTVVFAVLEVAGGQVDLAGDVTYLPKCCCGDMHCI